MLDPKKNLKDNSPLNLQDEIKARKAKNIAQGVVASPELPETASKIIANPYKGMERYRPNRSGDYYDDFEKYIENTSLKSRRLSMDDMLKQRSENQSNWDKAGNALGRIAYNVVPQTIGGFASMLDIPGYWDAEHAANNAIVNWASGLKEHVDQDLFPIYEDPNGGAMNIDDFGWWMSRGSGLAESVASFALQGMGAAKIASTALKGLGTLGKAATFGKAKNLAEAVRKSANVETRFGQGVHALTSAAAKKTISEGAKTLTTAMMLNQSEAVIEASQVYKSTFEEQLQKTGGNTQKAKELAAAAASTTMKLNRLNIVLNLTSASAFLRPFKQTRQLYTAGSIGKSLGKIGIEGAQEATEELINHVASKAGTARGQEKEYTFNDALKDIGTMEGFEAAFLGAWGGIGQTGATTLINSTYKNVDDGAGGKITKREWEKQRYEVQQKVINELKAKGVNVTDVMLKVKDRIQREKDLSEALANNDEAKYNELNKQRFEMQAYEAFSSGTTEVLEGIYESEAARTDVEQEHRDNAKEALKNIKVLENVYNNFEELENIKEVFDNRANKIRVDKFQKITEAYQKNAQEELYPSVDTIAKKYKFKKQVEVLIKENGETKAVDKRTEEFPLSYQLTNLSENQGDTEENKAIYSKFLAEVEKLDSYQKNDSYTKQLEKLKDTSSMLETQMKEITDVKYQEKYKEKTQKEKIKKDDASRLENIEDLAELEKLHTKYKDENPIFGNIIKERIKVVKSAVAANKQEKADNLRTAEFRMGIENISQNLTPEEFQRTSEIMAEQIDAQPLPDKNKQELKDALEKRARIYNGEELTDQEIFEKMSNDPGKEEYDEVKFDDEVKDKSLNEYVDPTKEEEFTEKELGNVAIKITDTEVLDFDYERSDLPPSNKVAHASREFKQIESGLVVEREEITNDLSGTDVLFPNVALQGTKVEIEVDTQYSGEVYISNSTTKEKMLWLDREAQLIEKYGPIDYTESVEYISEVPIRVKAVDGTFSQFLHDVNWVQEQNVKGDESFIEAERETLLNYRRVVLENKKNNKKTESAITYKGNGTLMIDKNQSIKNVKEGLGGNYTLAIARNGKLTTQGEVLGDVLGEADLSNRLHAVITTSNGSKIALPLQRGTLQQEHIDSVIEAIRIYMEQDSTSDFYNSLKSQQDILTLPGLSKYISKIVALYNLDKGQSLNSVIDRKTDDFHSAIHLLAITGNSIEFGKPGVNSGASFDQETRAVVISRGFKESSDVIETKLNKLRSHLEKMIVNADTNTFARKESLTLFKDGVPVTINYSQFLEENFTTNVIGVNIGTEETPYFTHTIQPTITFDTSFTKDVVKSEQETVTELEALEESTKQSEIIIEEEETKSNEKREDVEIKLANGSTLVINKEEKDLPNDEYSNEDFSLPTVTEESEQAFIDELAQYFIDGIDGETQHSLISYMTSVVAEKSAISKDGVYIKKVLELEKQSLRQTEAAYREVGFVNKADKLKIVIDQFDKVEKFTGQMLEKLSTGKVTENTIENVEESVGELEQKIYSDDTKFTTDSKNTASGRLKKFLGFTRNVDENGKEITNVLGLPEMIMFDTAYDTLHEILAGNPADFNVLLQRIEEKTDVFPWLASIKKRLIEAPSEIQNEFVTDMTKHAVKMQFVMWSKDKYGNFSVQNWSSNSSATEQRLREIWSSNLKARTGLLFVNEKEEYVYNTEVIETINNQFQEWKDSVKQLKVKSQFTIPFEDLDRWLKNFGITISQKGYNSLVRGDFKDKEGVRLTLDQLVLNDQGLLNVLNKQASRKKNTILSDDNSILTDTVVKKLSKIEAFVTSNIFSNSFQAGNKTIYSFTNNNYLVNRVRDLLDEKSTGKTLRDSLKSKALTGNSLWLSDIEKGGVSKEAFDLQYLSLEALKQKWSKSGDKRKLNNLSRAEHEITKLGLFFNSSSNLMDGELRRTVRYFYPTMSDKSTMIMIQALSKEVVLDENRNLSNENIDLLFEQIVKPEMLRMSTVGNVDIKGYEAKALYFLPTLNSFEVEINGELSTFRDLILRGDGMNPEVVIQVKNEIQRIFNELVDSKKQEWVSMGIGITDTNTKIRNSFIDKSYISSITAKNGTPELQVDYAIKDFVFNTLLANAESYKLFAGDPALYAKFDSKLSIEENLENSFVNMGKRLAGDIAPGMELADAANNEYVQLFLADQKVDSNNLKDSFQKEYFEKINEYYTQSKGGYGKIEGSDAQEYTTWREHLYVLEKLGRITKKQHDLFSEKIKSGQDLSYKELGTVLQPIKPVYVGNIDSNRVDRRIYIKSSSFPLIPQLVRNFELEGLMKAMEQLEAKEGKTVRASFGTANKVGAPKNTVSVFNENGNVNNEIKITEDNYLTLSRKNFRIQLDVPYKESKSEINIGTQNRSLLLVNLLDVEIEPGVKGEDLIKNYNMHYQNLFEDAKESLLKSLGIDEDVSEIDTSDSKLEISDEILNSLKTKLKKELSKDSSLLENLEVSLEDIDNMSFDQLGEQIQKICK